MGIQGMTNWKFSAFLAITLMLVAGLFSSTAMAAANDGQGSITLGVTAGTDFQIASGDLPQVLLAGEAGYTLTFTYTVGDTGDVLPAINMSGGMIEIAIPGDGWKVPKANVTVTDGADTLIATDADGDDALKRIVFTGGDNLTKIGVKLDADWNVAADATQSLSIVITGVTTGTPNSLYVPQTGRPYREYTFRTRSMADKGTLRSLVIAADGANPQPVARVGNVGDGKGQVDVSLVVYEAETANNIELVFTAAGPMYDTTGVDAAITISAPDGLTAPQITDPAGAGYVTVSRQSGTVLFERPNQKIEDPSGQTITIDIARMEKGAKIYVAYRKVDTPAIGAATAAPYTAQSLSNSALAAVTVKPDGNHLRAVAGSGEIKLTRGEVVSAGTKPTLTFTYKAATKLADATLVIDQPDGGGWTDFVLQSGDLRNDNYVSISGGGNAALDLDPASTDSNQNVSGSAGQAITLRGVDLNAGASVTVTITRITLTGAAGTDPLVPVTNGVYAWQSALNETPSDTDVLADPMLYVVGDARASVAFQIIAIPDSDTADPADANPVALPHYNAASKENIRFQFATTTPIKGGYVQFTIPNGWAQPSLTDVAGKATVKLVGYDGTNATLTTPAADADMTLAVNGNTITVNIVKSAAGDITVQYGTGTGDNRGMVQNRAVDNLEIVGRFKTGSSSGAHPAAAPVSVRVGNVAAGSGTAMITTPGSYTVEAGSDDNNITIVYRAAGTMTGGTVRLQSPANWGTLQETDTAADNHIRVAASSSMVNQADISYGPRYVLVPLMNVQANNTVSFVFSNVKAQPTIGIAEFTIESAGGPSDGLMRLMGEALPKDADDKNIVDRYMLLGKVYVPRFAEGGAIPERISAVATAEDVTNDTGVIRLEVVAGAGGTGEAKLDRIARTDAGLRNYLNADGDALVSERRVHAGDSEIYLVFKYTPVQTITDGALRFTVPTDWTEPQEDSPNKIGYTTVRPSGANIGAPMFENQTVTIPIVDITSGNSIEIHYGSGSFGATAPKTRQVGDAASDFLFAVKGTGGTFESLGPAPVNVYSQASGEGSASVEAMNATAGAPDGSITITYDPEGQIANGRIKLTVPDALTGGADGAGVTAAHISVSTGTPKYGGSVDLDLDANSDVTKNDVLVSGVNLDADDEFTFTYEGMMPEAAGDLSFTVAVDGGEGPGEVVDGMPAPAALIDGSGALTVTVGQAAAGSGTVSVTQDPGAVVAGSPGNTITVTYTAIGGIGEGKTITVEVPDGWSAPLNEAAADEKMGTFTAMHYLKLADDDADGMADMGDAVAASVTTEEMAVAGQPDPVPMTMVATVADGKMVKAGDMVVFTYTNATAPDATGGTYFTTEYDGEQVGEDADIKVIVQSAEGATAVTLAADDFNVDTDGSTTVTVTLVDSNGDPATRSEDTMVDLEASSGTLADITIEAGEYHGEATLTATAAANITVTANVEGFDEVEIMVHADTDNVMIDSVSLSQTVAKADDTVMITVMGSAAQEGMFSVGDVITDEDLMEDEAGSYTGSFTVVADLQDGMHTVTVSLNGTSDDSMSVTIDTMVPTVTAETDAADTVANGDTVTITAMADDGDGSGIASVMADVSALDTTQTDPVALMMGDDGYSAEITISMDNEAANGTHAITVTATDNAGNESEMASADVMLQNSISFTSMIQTGANLFHVPLNDPDITTIGSLRAALGDAVTSLIVRKDGGWEPNSDDVMITSDLGIYLVATSDVEITFEGDAWEDTTINLESGANLIGLPVNDLNVTMASDISGLFADGVVISVTAGSGGQYTTVSATNDVAVAGDAGYYIVAGDVTGGIGMATLTGDGWMTDDAASAPIALSGYRIENQTPALAVYGSVTDEITGLAKEGFRVKAKNLTTKAGLSEITSIETAEGYSMAFVDLKNARAARVGDILEISADSPSPLIGVKPVRHVVTVDDVKNGRITLEDLIAYEIPAETELLRNYPNPFNPETWIPYHLSEDADVSLTIYDVNGALVRDIDVGHQTAAKYDTRAKAIYWDGRNQFGEQVASGIYFYSLSAGDFSATRKMVILK